MQNDEDLFVCPTYTKPFVILPFLFKIYDMKKAIQSESKDCNHSSKLCVCGGHSRKDVKKNKKHNSTKQKLQRRAAREILNKNAI
jgi:hypothetical protein